MNIGLCLVFLELCWFLCTKMVLYGVLNGSRIYAALYTTLHVVQIDGSS